MSDKYRCFTELATKENDQSFRIRTRKKDGTPAIIAPHGGGIEPGTTEIAEAIAGDDYSYYIFEGLKPKGNRDLHITSTCYDEPDCIALTRSSDLVLAIHGENSDRPVVFIGGLDEHALTYIETSLRNKAFTVEVHKNPDLQGRHPSNICNRSARAVGVQLELSRDLRRTFFERLDSREGRERGTPQFQRFVAAVRGGLELACNKVSNVASKHEGDA